MGRGVAAELFVLEVNDVPDSGLAVENVDRPGFGIARTNRNSRTDAGNSIQRTTSTFSATLIRVAAAVCRSTPGSTCTTGLTIICPNITVILSGQCAQVVLC